jgi:DNA topoisomerase-1
MKLVIVESPSKAKTINKYLGNDYHVISSVGHIIDLPKSKLGVDTEHNYKPQYEVIKGKEKVIKELKANAKKATEILLATDPDREGEAISWHIANTLGKTNPHMQRIVFHEITKPAILEALKHPRAIDQNLVDAQQARRVLDRLVGYKLSPLLWKKIRFGLSAGRVQSVALRLIVDREMECRAFKPEEYWSVAVVPTEDSKKKAKIVKTLSEDEKPKTDEGAFILDLKKINGKAAEIGTTKEFDKVSDILTKDELKIESVSEKTITRRPNPPFTTSTFQQAAVNVLGMTSKNAMRSAQKLYENGLITYMRTDSLYISNSAIDAARKVAEKKYGKKFVPEKPNYYKNSSKSAQEAHEAIRPTSFDVTQVDKKLSVYEQKVYDLIHRRALASQMSPAQFLQKTVSAHVESKNEKVKSKKEGGIETLDLSSTARKCTFEGWMTLYKISENKALIKILDDIKEGSILYSDEIHGVQHFTEPPARYTEASLIKALEKHGIGRPSTYATIVSVIMQRDYVEKDGKYFFPTDTGIVVTNMLKTHFKDIVDIDFTAEMEGDLDRVAEGKVKWQPMIASFFVPFEQNIAKKDKEIKKDDLVILGESDEKCPICGKEMVKKLGRFGPFLSCIDFPKCKGMAAIEGAGSEAAPDSHSEEFLKKYKAAPKTDDGRDYLLKKGRFGEFWAHPDYPKVKDIKSLEFTDQMIVEMFGKAPKASDGKTMILRKGKFGYFWSHPDYPEVKELQKAKMIKKEE